MAANCQVCGGTGSERLRNNVNVCQPCFKFQNRAFGKKDLLCYGNRDCKITPTSRRCRLCRLLKFLRIGMEMLGPETNELCVNFRQGKRTHVVTYYKCSLCNFTGLRGEVKKQRGGNVYFCK